MKRYIVNLTPEERVGLEQLCSRGKTSALTIQRAQILLRADDGLTDEDIVQELRVGRAAVERVRQRCVMEGLSRTLERKRQDQLRTVRTRIAYGSYTWLRQSAGRLRWKTR